MVKDRTIMIFPHFENIGLIDEIRDKYDPLAKLVRPHITLVFPFRSELSNEDIIAELYGKLQGYNKFKITLQGIGKISEIYGNYLFLLVKEGIENLVDIHDRLYSGIFNEYKFDTPYSPHMTIGKLETEQSMNNAFDRLCDFDEIFKTVVDKISVEMIGENGESIIEIEYPLV